MCPLSQFLERVGKRTSYYQDEFRQEGGTWLRGALGGEVSEKAFGSCMFGKELW